MANGVTTEDPWTHKLTGKTWEMLVLLSTKRPVFFGKRVTKIVSCRFFSGVRQMFMVFHTDAHINFCLHSCEQAVLSLQTPKPDIHVACTFLQGHSHLACKPHTTSANPCNPSAICQVYVSLPTDKQHSAFFWECIWRVLKLYSILWFGVGLFKTTRYSHHGIECFLNPNL